MSTAAYSSTLGTITGDFDPNVGTHTNPYRQYLQKFTPRNLKELFKWCEYLYYNSPHIYAALRKFGEYPITEITYDTPSKDLREKHEYLLEKVLKIRAILIETTLDKFVYGNSFTTMYQPFVRHLQCPKCHVLTNINTCSYSFDIKKISFKYTCSGCNLPVEAKQKNIQDKKLMLGRKVNFIRWDPKLMNIDYNEITGESDYYYTIPPSIVQRITSGHKALIDTIPIGFLEAVRDSKTFKFAPNAVFHMKMTGPAGITPQWGLPPLLSVMSRFHYTEVLRKANEAIALDHLVPFRMLHPAQASSTGDPLMQVSMSRWLDSMKGNLKAWRKDPLHIMFSPFPMGATQLGGEGRALLTLGEVQESEKGIAAALGIPMEFLYGGLTGSGMEATLRLIENQLETHIQDLLELLQWIDDKCSNFLGWESIPVGMTKFRMVDDDNNKNVVFQLWQAGLSGAEKVVSTSTVAKMFGLDIDKEKAKIRQESIEQIKEQQELKQEADKIQNTMKSQIQAQAQQEQEQGGATNNLGYNQQQVIEQADQITQQLMSMDEGTRKSQLHQLQTEDVVMYAVVIQRLEQIKTSQKQQATAGM
jgi:hypothetical protein